MGFEEGKDDHEPERPCKYNEEEEEPEESFSDLIPIPLPKEDREDASAESDERDCRDVFVRRSEPCIAIFDAIASNLLKLLDRGLLGFSQQTRLPTDCDPSVPSLFSTVRSGFSPILLMMMRQRFVMYVDDGVMGRMTYKSF